MPNDSAQFAPKKPQDSGNDAALIGDIPKPPRLTLRLRDQPHANRPCLRNKHARECRV